MGEQKQTTRWRRWRCGRFNPFRFHVALSLRHGITIWPRGPWPKEPILDWWWVKHEDGWRRS